MPEPKHQAALAEIRRNIAEHGFHIYVVTGGGYPHYGYTIGLHESVASELVLAGSYFYRLDEVSDVIRSVAASFKAPLAQTDDNEVATDLWGKFSLRTVDSSWSKGLMLGVFDYYKVKSINAYQIVPDAEHWTVDVPNLSMPWKAEEAQGWRWLYEDWQYPVPANSMALTDLDALHGKPITELMRWEKDEWEIFSGPGLDFPESERRVVPLGVLLGADPSLLPVVHLPVGRGLWRDVGSDWHPWGTSKNI